MGSVSGELNDILSFDSTCEGVTVIDHIENRKCEICTSGHTSIQDAPTHGFTFPVDKATSINTSEILVKHNNSVYIWNHNNIVIEEISQGGTQSLPYGEYTIEIPFPIKLYISIDSKIEIKSTPENVRIRFDDSTKVLIGARSHHEKPSGTIKITEDTSDLMKAISYLGSGLKTTTCERSYPTLRGHPPTFNLSEDFMIPSVLEKPETGITIEVPENYREIFVIMPLAYYFGANVVPGETPLIKSSEGLVHDLGGTPREFEDEVERVLKQCFFLDCITRTEGYYQVKLHEREEIEPELELDFSDLYNQPISEQIRSYLSVPYDIISEHIPMWKNIAHVDIDPDNIEILPYLINDLSIIRSNQTSHTTFQKTNTHDDELDKYRKNKQPMSTDDDILNKNDIFRPGETPKEGKKLIEIPESRALEHTLVGDGIPTGATKAIHTAYKNQLDEDPTDGDIDIAVIVNDKKMVEEGVIVDDIYNSRDQLAPNTELQQQLTKSELRQIFNQEYDFLHYIGHIGENGFKCADGDLDVTKLKNISIRTFLLNACTSYQQAIGLIRSGSIAGIATIKPVLNSGAERIGKAVARLLNLGFPLISALDVAKSESIMGDNYIVIGDGGVNLTQPKGEIPSLCLISNGEKSFKTTYKTFPTKRENIGAITLPYAKDNKKYHLVSGDTGSFEMAKNELLRFILMGQMPIEFNSSLYWGNENEFVNQL